MQSSYKNCAIGFTLVCALGIVVNAYLFHYWHARAEITRAERYYNNNCLDSHAVISEGKVDDCHRREDVMLSYAALEALHMLLAGVLNAFKLAIWVEVLNESVLKLILTVFVMLILGALGVMLMLVQNDLRNRSRELLPNKKES